MMCQTISQVGKYFPDFVLYLFILIVDYRKVMIGMRAVAGEDFPLRCTNLSHHLSIACL